jgi:stearoyl-CoA desaturase (delta-9 desaturase)
MSTACTRTGASARCCPFWAAGVINGLGHWWGYRNFETDDAATNLSPWAILIGGEELHNNHHAAPGSARLSARWFEFDVGWAYIRLMQAIGLARVRSDAFSHVRTPSGALPAAAAIDKRFVRDVVLPILRDERESQLEQLLESSERLRTAYESRLALADIWRRASGDLDAVRREFRDWCQRAEQSGARCACRCCRRRRPEAAEQRVSRHASAPQAPR